MLKKSLNSITQYLHLPMMYCMNTSVSATLHISAHLYGDITSVFTYLSTTECSQYPSAGSDIESRMQKRGNVWWGAQQVWCGAARYAGELRPNEIRELFLLSFLEVLPPNHLMGPLDQKEMALTPTYFCFENVNLRGPGWPGFERLHFFCFCTFFWCQTCQRKWWKELWVLCEASTFRLGQAACEVPALWNTISTLSRGLGTASGARLWIHSFLDLTPLPGEYMRQSLLPTMISQCPRAAGDRCSKCFP